MKRKMLRYPFTIWLLVFMTAGLSAQNSRKGFKLLEKSEYEKSREVFLEALNENKASPSALFGLSLILADEKSAYFDLIGSWEYASRLKDQIDNLTPEENEFIGEYFYNTEARHISRPVRKKIDYALETIEAKLIKYIREENNLDLVYQVLEKFPDFRHYDNVVHIRNQLEFRKYEKMNKLEGYLEFMQKFPEAAQIEKAIKYRDRLAYENARQLNTVNAYKDYIRQYPQAAEINLAIKQLHAVAFEDAKQKNTIAAFDEFIEAYPEALEISEAKVIQKQLLFEYARKIHTLEAYNEFIRKYPDGQQYIDIFNLKAQDNGMRFITEHPLPSNNLQWARSFDEEDRQELSACMTVDTMNFYVTGGTVFKHDSGSTEAWIIKLSSDGKMLWNKYIGEGYNDQVDLLRINSKNEVLGAGYTWIGMDSSSVQSWLFKIGPDGQKLWSKKLGKMHIRTMIPVASGSVFLGGYLLDDSLRSKYSVIVLNENGKRLWSRTYTGAGEIMHIAEFPDKRMLLAGTRWRAKIDPKGYLIWESSFGISDSMVAAQIMPKGEICYLGYRNQEKLIFTRTSTDNKLLAEKELKLPELPVKVNSLILGPQNQLIALFSFDRYQTIAWINAVTGEISNEAKIADGIQVKEILTDRSNNLLLVACQGQILVIKNKGMTF